MPPAYHAVKRQKRAWKVTHAVERPHDACEARSGDALEFPETFDHADLRVGNALEAARHVFLRHTSEARGQGYKSSREVVMTTCVVVQ